jgi:hypothetical protein
MGYFFCDMITYVIPNKCNMLSVQKYSLLCILGGEVVYALCATYGLFLSGKAAELHLSIFQMLPGFTEFSISSWLIGAITIAIWSGLGGAYIAWMHNVSKKA